MSSQNKSKRIQEKKTREKNKKASNGRYLQSREYAFGEKKIHKEIAMTKMNKSRFFGKKNLMDARGSPFPYISLPKNT